jgi:SurA-like protein
VKAYAGLAAAVALALGMAACGGSSSATVAKVGPQSITEKQLDAVFAYDRSRLHLDFPRRGSAEYRLLRRQAIDFLVEQSRAHQADAKLGIAPQDRVVSDAAFRKVTANVHVTDSDVRRYFEQHRTKRQLDRGTAEEIRQQLLDKRRATAMHAFVAAVRRDYPVSYGPGYTPVPMVALARKIWKTWTIHLHPSHKRCDLLPGWYQYTTAVEHGCDKWDGPVVINEAVCPIVDPPHTDDGGFSSAEMDDGFFEYVADTGGTCWEDPRAATVEVTAAQIQAHTPVRVSYIPRAGTATYKDRLLGYTLRYPRRLHIQHVSYGDLMSVEGVEVANYPIDASASSRPLSTRAVDLFFTQASNRLPGPAVVTGARLPIRISDADLASGRYTTQVSADGTSFRLTRVSRRRGRTSRPSRRWSRPSTFRHSGSGTSRRVISTSSARPRPIRPAP